jgi:hypothetical protein
MVPFCEGRASFCSYCEADGLVRCVGTGLAGVDGRDVVGDGEGVVYQAPKAELAHKQLDQFTVLQAG